MNSDLRFLSIAKYLRDQCAGNPTRIVDSLKYLVGMIQDGYAFPSVNEFNTPGVIVAEPARKLTNEDLKSSLHEKLPGGEMAPDLGILRISNGLDSCRTPEEIAVTIADMAAWLSTGCAAPMIDPAFGGPCLVAHLQDRGGRPLNKAEAAAIRARQALVDMPVEGEVRQ